MCQVKRGEPLVPTLPPTPLDFCRGANSPRGLLFIDGWLAPCTSDNVLVSLADVQWFIHEVSVGLWLLCLQATSSPMVPLASIASLLPSSILFAILVPHCSVWDPWGLTWSQVHSPGAGLLEIHEGLTNSPTHTVHAFLPKPLWLSLGPGLAPALLPYLSFSSFHSTGRLSWGLSN